MSKAVKLTAKWQLDAALLSRPVDLTALVTMSRSHPNKFTEDDTLRRLVKLLLNEKNASKVRLHRFSSPSSDSSHLAFVSNTALKLNFNIYTHAYTCALMTVGQGYQA